MNHWESLVDRKVKEVIGDGNISHLPGAGKPLDLDDDTNTPEHLRLAYKIMRDHDVMPDWVGKLQILNQLEDKLHKQINIRADRYLRELKKAQRRGTILDENNIEADWKAYITEFIERVGRYNRDVLSYNISVPNGIPHKQILDSDKMIQHALCQNGDN
jgi:hypothetical protein